jgi:hypothetical protein
MRRHLDVSVSPFVPQSALMPRTIRGHMLILRMISLQQDGISPVGWLSKHQSIMHLRKTTVAGFLLLYRVVEIVQVQSYAQRYAGFSSVRCNIACNRQFAQTN